VVLNQTSKGRFPLQNPAAFIFSEMPDIRPRITENALKMGARIKTRGPGEVLSVGAARIREWIRSEERLIILFRDVMESSAPTESRPDSALVFREATSADSARYAADIGTDSPASFRRRLTSNTRCFIVVSDGLFVHSTWVTTAAAWTREIQRYFCPPPGDAYIYESFTRPEVRGRGVYPFALDGITDWLAKRSIGRAWIGAEADNQASLRALHKAGFREGFQIPYGRRLGRLVLEPPAGRMADDRLLCRHPLPRGADGAGRRGA
jgi:RimJ/RimL family protein N-acetyltransferase